MYTLVLLAGACRPFGPAADDPSTESSPSTTPTTPSPSDTPTDDTGPDDGTGPFDDDLGLVCGPAAVPLPAAASPVPSLPFLTTSNGFVTATYVTEADGVPAAFTDGTYGTVAQRHELATLTDHLTRNPTPTTSTRDVLWDAYWGVRIDGVSTWLDAVPEDGVAYEPGTGVVTITQTVGSAAVTTRIFAPFQDGGARDLVMVSTVSWTGAGTHDVALVALHNVHTGGEGRAEGEVVTPSGGGVLESRGGDRVLHTPIGAATAAAGPGGDPFNPWMRFTAGQDYDGTLISGSDVAVGFQWSGPVSSTTSLSAGTVISFDSTDRSGWLAGRTAVEVLDDERAAWDVWHAVDVLPPAATDDERAVARQSLAVLRMAQVREPGPGYGQILASLPPGGWNIAWPRDAAYATVGLVTAGHADEARAALAFVVDGDAGQYAALLGLDDYLVSVARYYGDGTEESDGASCPDGSDAGPNVELDDFGLFLWAWGEFAAAFPEDPFVAETLDAVVTGVADPLVSLIAPNDLLVADSSIWERHWESCFPNGRKQFSYSSIQAVAGLRRVADLTGEPSYDAAADRIRAGLLRFADQGGPVVRYTSRDGQDCAFLASSPEETCAGCGPYDASVIELVNHGIVRPESTLARGTLDALQGRLAVFEGSPGFLRGDDGSGTTNPYPWYDDQEWVVIDLRMAAAYATVGRATGDPILEANGVALLDWVTAQARVNHDLLGELLSDGIYTPEDDADHTRLGVDLGGEVAGSAPMCGFGPGAYLLALEAVR